VVEEAERLLCSARHRGGVLDGIPDGRRTADPLRVPVRFLGPVVGEPLDHPAQPAHHERDVAPEHAAVLVDLVYHDCLQALEEPLPQAMRVGGMP